MKSTVHYWFFDMPARSFRERDAIEAHHRAALESLGLGPHIERDTGAVRVRVDRGSQDELTLLTYAASIDAFVYRTSNTQVPKDKQVICFRYELDFEDTDSTYSRLGLGGAMLFDDLFLNRPPWFSYQDKIGVPLELLLGQERMVSTSPACFQYPDFDSREPYFVPDCVKRELEQVGIRGIGFRQVTPVLSVHASEDEESDAQLEIRHSWNRVTRLCDIVFGEYPSDLPPWWVITPQVVLPPTHPLWERYNPHAKRGTDDRITDPTYRGPVRCRSPLFDGSGPIYTPEAIRAMDDVDIACTFEHSETDPLTVGLIFSDRGKELISPYLVEPRWSRVGILPANSPVLGGSG
jgi:hypothetical protein